MIIEESSEIVIIYHGNCPDGNGSALAAFQKFGEGAEYIPVSYGEKFDIERLRNKIVYVLDFSFPLAVIQEIMKICQIFMIIDHHKTAEADLAPLPNNVKIFDMGHSGAYLAWEYFNGHSIPEMMLYLEDRDLWRWRMPESREINRALQSYGLDNFRVWSSILEGWLLLSSRASIVNKLLLEGQAILRQCDAFVEHMVNTAEEIVFEGTPTLVANATVLFSEVPSELLKLKPPMSIGWFYDGKRKLYQVSLRSEGEFDVSVLAKKYGGGGHKNAAGFTCTELPWRHND